MPSKNPWPMWLKIVFHNDPNIEGIECSISCGSQMIDIVHRYRLSPSNTIELRVNDFSKKLSEERVENFYKWVEEIRVEVIEDEARKKAEKESKDSNQSSGTGSKGMANNQKLG
jgi:hypothetical protein